MDYALAKKSSDKNNAVKISVVFMSIVVFFNIVKVVTLFLVLRDRDQAYLVTCGDAIASFLACPQEATKGYCVATSEEVCQVIAGTNNFWKPSRAWRRQEGELAGGDVWRPKGRPYLPARDSFFCVIM